MTYEAWYEVLEIIFEKRLGYSPKDTGWFWEEIYKEGFTPLEAIQDYINSISYK